MIRTMLLYDAAFAVQSRVIAMSTLCVVADHPECPERTAHLFRMLNEEGLAERCWRLPARKVRPCARLCSGAVVVRELPVQADPAVCSLS